MILYYILFTIISLFIIISIVWIKKFFNPILIINSVYLIWFVLGRINFLGQYIPTYNSSIFLCFNVLLLDLGLMIGYLIKPRNKKKENITKNFDSDKIYNFIRIFSFFVSSIIFLNLVLNLINGKLSIDKIRDISYSIRTNDNSFTKIYFNSAIYCLYQYIIRGFIFFDLTYNIGKLIFKKNNKIPILSITNFILFILIMQSRIEFMKFVIFIIIFFLFSNIKLNEKQKKSLKKASIVLIIAIFITFSIRSLNKNTGVLQNTINSFIIDFSGSNYMFSTFFYEYNNGLIIKDSPIIFKYLGGIGLGCEHVLNLLGFNFDHSEINLYLTIGHNIGSSDHYNAFYTIYFDFINSGGFFGCFIFSILFGIIIGYFYNKKCKYMTLKNNYMASFFTYIMVMGTYYYAFSGIYSLVIICCIFLLKKDLYIEGDDYKKTK